MNRPKVLVTHGDIPEKAVLMLKEKCDLIICPLPERADLLEKVKGVNAVFWFTKEKMDQEMLDAAGGNLKVIGTMSSGYDHIDVLEVKRRGILIGSVPRVLHSAVAELAIGLFIAAARRFHEAQHAIMSDNWVTGAPQWLLGMEVRGSTVGIVGFGGIGQTIARRLKGFEVGKIIYCGHSPKKEAEEIGAEFVSFDELLQRSDFVAACCPLTPETKKMFNDEAFSKMKKTAVLINVGRGDLVDHDALIRALKGEKIWAAGLDVMTPEPLPPDHPLTSLKNCFLLPHLGSATFRTREEMATLTARNILCGLEGKPLPSPLMIYDFLRFHAKNPEPRCSEPPLQPAQSRLLQRSRPDPYHPQSYQPQPTSIKTGGPSPPSLLSKQSEEELQRIRKAHNRRRRVLNNLKKKALAKLKGKIPK